MDELADLRRKYSGGKPTNTENEEAAGDDDDKKKTPRAAPPAPPRTTTPPLADTPTRGDSGAEFINNDEYSVALEYTTWLWTDSKNNTCVSAVVHLQSGMRFEDGDVEVEVLNPETYDCEVVLSFKRSSAFTNPDFMYKAYKHHKHPSTFTKNHSLISGYHSAVENEVGREDSDPRSKMRIQIGVPCEEALAILDVPRSIHVVTEIPKSCREAKTIQEAMQAGMNAKQFLVVHLMGPRSKFRKKIGSVEGDNSGFGWYYEDNDEDDSAGRAFPRAASAPNAQAKRYRTD